MFHQDRADLPLEEVDARLVGSAGRGRKEQRRCRGVQLRHSRYCLRKPATKATAAGKRSSLCLTDTSTRQKIR